MSQELYPELPILIVDDEKKFLESMDFTLRSEGINNVERSRDSREVMPLLGEKKYSLILLDLGMPHVSGKDLLPCIIEEYPEIPVIVLTGAEEVETAVECMKRGARDYLKKPIDTARLIEEVENSLDFLGLKKEGHEDSLTGKEEGLRDVDKTDPDYWETHFKKANTLLRSGKAPAVISKILPLVEHEEINKNNIKLFYTIGRAYEKIEKFAKAEGIYRDIEGFDPQFPGIHQKLGKIEKLKKDILDSYYKERYEIIREIGKGGFGVVSEARDTMLGRLVALKILNSKSIEKEKDIERFASEAKKAAKLKHGNIVGVHDYGQIEKDYFISMEFIEGMDLDKIITKKNLDIPGILIIARSLFKALEHSHKNGVIHRDIKPQNIMITYDNEVKVVDFGLAVLRDEVKRKRSYTAYGTLFYMSPEQITSGAIDHLTDIYSAGVTLFHLVNGKVPYDGERMVILNKILSETTPPLDEFRQDTPEALVNMIQKCMAKNKEDRYPDAGQVIEVIEGMVDNSGAPILTNKTKLKIFGEGPGTISPTDGDSPTQGIPGT